MACEAAAKEVEKASAEFALASGVCPSCKSLNIPQQWIWQQSSLVSISLCQSFSSEMCRSIATLTSSSFKYAFYYLYKGSGLELCLQVINNDLPTTLDSMERASLEFEELGQSLNGLTGALRRPKPTPKPGAKGKGQALAKTEGEQPAEATETESAAAAALNEMSAVEAIQAGTVNSMRKVAQDVSALAAVSYFPL